MRRAHLPLLCCPGCSGGLSAPGSGEHLNDAELTCDGCDATYPVVGGIPRFVPDEEYTSSFGYQWLRHARTQLDSVTGVPVSERRFFDVTGWPRRLDGRTILEAGGGAGRFTEVAASTGATVISVDYSRAVEANYAANGHRENVLIVQGDLFRPPVRPGSVDGVYCFGVLQHTPDPAAAFRALLPPLRPGGDLAVDVYPMRWWRYLVKTYYWLRPLTKRLPREWVYRAVRWWVKALWGPTAVINRLPQGRRINRMLLVADYRGELDLPDRTLREWAILDVFDQLTPRHDHPQRIDTVRSWFRDAGLQGIDVRYGHNGIQGRATVQRSSSHSTNRGMPTSTGVDGS